MYEVAEVGNSPIFWGNFTLNARSSYSMNIEGFIYWWWQYKTGRKKLDLELERTREGDLVRHIYAKENIIYFIAE